MSGWTLHAVAVDGSYVVIKLPDGTLVRYYRPA